MKRQALSIYIVRAYSVIVSEFILRLPIVIGMADHEIAPIAIGAKFKDFPYHMGDSVEIKKI